MDTTRTWTIGSDLAAVGRVTRDVIPWLAAHAVVDPLSYRVQLVLEEVLANVVRHGCEPGAAHRIVVTVALLADGVRIEVDDDGRPFDPRAFPEFDVATPLAERRAGGLGLHLVRQSARSIDYRRDAERNLLCIELDAAS